MILTLHVPEGLTKRCLKTINAHFSNMRRSSSLRIVKKAINLAAVLDRNFNSTFYICICNFR